MIRYRMNKLIRLLEKNDSEAINAAIASPRYVKALNELENLGCIKTVRSWGGDIVRVWLDNRYVSYQLSRRDVWLNRLWGFISGVAVTLAAEFLPNAIGR
ncbi:MAG: hypothetical protein IKE52_02535 [Mogibacterium sp.]|nr:hypothetical protein [Mogibacterium sp.]